MNKTKPSKCKNCQWYGKPYWSIINPCDNCPNDMELIYAPSELEDYTIDIEKIIEEKDKEIERLNNVLQEIKCLIHKAINERETNGVGELNLTRILSLLDEEGDNNEK